MLSERGYYGRSRLKTRREINDRARIIWSHTRQSFNCRLPDHMSQDVYKTYLNTDIYNRKDNMNETKDNWHKRVTKLRVGSAYLRLEKGL